MLSLESHIAHITEQGIKLVPATSNPGPLGLFAFALTTALLQCNNVFVVDHAAHGYVYGYGMFFGGLTQLIAGILEYQRRNTFGTTAFSSFGAFWMGLAYYGTMVSSGAWEASSDGLRAVLALWGIYTFMLWLCTFSTNVVLSSLFFTLGCLFILLCGGQVNRTLLKFAGCWGFVVAGIAFYAGLAGLMEDTYGRPVLPVWPLPAINNISSGFIGTKRRTDRDIGEPQDVEVAHEGGPKPGLSY